MDVFKIVCVVFLFQLYSSNQVLSFVLNVEPQTIEPGITDSLLINCSIPKDSGLKLSVLNSLVLSRKSDNISEQYVELASINTITQRVEVYNDADIDDVSAKGVLDNIGDSYISLQWQYPVQSLAVEYRCDVHGMSLKWKPRTETTTKHVLTKEISLASLADQFREMKIKMNQIISENSNLENEIVLKSEEVSELKQNMSQTNKKYQKFMNNFMSRIEKSRNWYFKVSPVYRGRRYYLSQQNSITRSEEAMSICVFNGGYLAEIHEMEEQAFVATFLKQFTGFSLVLLGGVDEGHEGTWVYRVSNTSVPAWLIHLRRRTNYDCLYLYKDLNWLGLDNHCNHEHPVDYPSRFLCEIPLDFE